MLKVGSTDWCQPANCLLLVCGELSTGIESMSLEMFTVSGHHPGLRANSAEFGGWGPAWQLNMQCELENHTSVCNRLKLKHKTKNSFFTMGGFEKHCSSMKGILSHASEARSSLYTTNNKIPEGPL